MNSTANIAQKYFDAKTMALLEKYGPGPRVHYHVGIFDGIDTDTTTDIDTIRSRIVASQEQLLDYAAQIWDAKQYFTADLLDVGCGLGGGSIYWAQNYDVCVTAVTNVPSHIPLIAEFAGQAGVSHVVHPLLCDAAAIPGNRRFDAAVAFESLCYMDRRALFRKLHQVLRPGGRLFIEDAFLMRPQWRQVFDQYWKTRIGTIDEYKSLACDAGFLLELDENVVDERYEFWLQSLAWLDGKLEQQRVGSEPYIKILEQIRYHASMFRAGHDHGIEVHLLRFLNPY
ncbi:SAM-dependent methyltransferase [Nocardia brasiliensis]